jgi:hypothetical protein
MISDFPRVMSEIRRLFLAIGILLLATGDGGAERINQEGRILGPAPQVARPTLFNTPEADAAGWISGDAAGLPMFPAVPRFDECERGMVEHAMRLAVAKTRREYIYPAVHYASSIPASSTNYPAMGQRLRLKASVVIPSNWTTEEKAILLGLKKSLRSQHEQTWPREAVQNRQVLFRWGLAPRDSSSFRASGVAV